MTAAQVIGRVVREGAYTQLALGAALDRGTLSSPDRGFTTELVYGTLRHVSRLDRALAAAARREPRKIDDVLLDLMRVAAYEALVLTGAADHAAVNEAVEAAKAVRGEGAAKFVNGVLRGLLRLRDNGALAPKAGGGVQGLCERTGLPEWLAQDVLARLGEAEAERFGAATLQRADLQVCVPVEADRGSVRASLHGAGLESVEHPWCPTALVLTSSPGGLEGALGGVRALAQNAASQAVATWASTLAAESGGPVLDLCAAPGGKSALLAARGVPVISGDLHPDKLHLARRQWERLSVAPRAVCLDGRTPPFRNGSMGTVLLDAPCSGTGLLSRRPEIKLRRGPADVERLVALQRQLLSAAAALVRPGGTLLYSVCSVSSAEGPAQAAWFAGAHAGFSRVERVPVGPESARAAGALELWPQRDQADGFYAVAFRRHA